ncbi:unnamed protein product [Rotaria sp. Silwood2]|nr:unnamed protein product [Rotaria sp. Silwood2]CAF3017659.1 unnamed protein product [Rotaria sp. Silwood2]CAF4235383.1 unnamed protein product [Rotaria sp. Silwood2]CAF4237413.1 unnamed protein product [Rotaria sp. Silwood2]CAF4306652.1 unnamed protein product [Rotaria sp. Silwood2]
MHNNEQILFISDQTDPIKRNKLFSQCKVCETDGAQVHYGGLCCISCKMFFRRNASFDLDAHQCVFREICDITINSRRACRYCRLQKCLAIGMQRELLRASHHRRAKSVEQIVSSSNTICTLDLLRNDRSLLTDEQRCCLSNVIHVYDTKSPVSHIRYLLSTQSRHPMKMRLKMAKTSILEIIISMYQGILPFVEALPEFHIMKRYDQCELIERNLPYVGGFNGIIVFRDAEVPISTAFKNGFPSIYGSTIVDDAVTIARRTDDDLTLIKLLIPILLFSTSCYIKIPSNVNNNYHATNIEMNSIFFNTKRLFDIQNTYIEIMFKYMIYRFGYNEASLRFAALIKSFLDQSTCIFRAGEIQSHDQLIQTIVKDTEVALQFQNESMD